MGVPSGQIMPTKIFLTDMMHHTRALRPSSSFAKVSKEGRLYLPPLKLVFDEQLGRVKFTLNLPDDLSSAIKQGLVELVVPEGGLHVVFGPDMLEKMIQLENKYRNQAIHQGRVWHSDQKS